MQNLILISNPLKKFQKTNGKKLSAKKWQKNGAFDFYYCVQRFLTYNFSGVICFALFSTDSISASNFVFMIPISKKKKQYFCLHYR
jgi:hypothetical protein